MLAALMLMFCWVYYNYYERWGAYILEKIMSWCLKRGGSSRKMKGEYKSVDDYDLCNARFKLCVAVIINIK